MVPRLKVPRRGGALPHHEPSLFQRPKRIVRLSSTALPPRCDTAHHVSPTTRREKLPAPRELADLVSECTFSTADKLESMRVMNEQYQQLSWRRVICLAQLVLHVESI